MLMPKELDHKSSKATVTTQVVKTLDKANGVMDWFKAIPSVAHVIRAVDRFNDRLGSQFGAAITYFSFYLLSLFDGVVCRRRFCTCLKSRFAY